MEVWKASFPFEAHRPCSASPVERVVVVWIVRRLAAGPGLEPSILQKRYEKAIAIPILNPGRDDRTLALWLEMIKEVQARRKMTSWA
jgi:hypothetical protein